MKSDPSSPILMPLMNVDILLSTFNGARYLRQQLDSILNQTHQTWRLLIRDDGSSDSTRSILQGYRGREPRILGIQDHEAHRGPCQSFAYLMQQSTAPYCMFCDQDDIWFPAKVQSMVSAMHAAEKEHGSLTPLLIVSDLCVINDKQDMIAPSFWKCQGLDPHTGSRFSSLIIQNKFPGCSMLLNHPLKELSQDIPGAAIMHDWWVAMAAAAFGRIIIMPHPSMYYRQHQSNTIGLAPTGSVWDILQSIGRSTFRIISRHPTALANLRNLEDLNEIKACRAFRDHFAHLLTTRQIAMLNSLINHSLTGVIKYRIFRQPLLSNINLFLVLFLLKAQHMCSSLKQLRS